MALEAPLRASTADLQFLFNQDRSMSTTPDTDGRRTSFRNVSSPPPHTHTDTLRPNSANRVSSNSMHILSPSDIVGPSPVTSNGTETTEIEDDASDEVHRAHHSDLHASHRSELLMLSTNLPENIRQGGSEEAVSVIHAPESFTSWTSTEPASQQEQRSAKSSPKTAETSPEISVDAKSKSLAHPPRPPISTDVKPVRFTLDSGTPQAQDLQDMLDEGSRLRSSSTSSLEKIDEQTEAEGDDEDDVDIDDPFPLLNHVLQNDDEVSQLRAALQECWTLCNRLAALSSFHRTKVFNRSDTPDTHEMAWKSCWKLCQRLYANETKETDSLDVRENLDLCRDFCQALFDVRQRNDESADSVLRVSFELNNHLYSAQDSRNLPEQFRERTLDFYITLCHRLMKQRGEMDEETDVLLRACWGLAEMLFSLRQNKREGKPPDEELLGSAVQACWDLCDIFRDGWTQIRPDRNTPRPSQTTFFSQQPSEQSGRDSRTSNRSNKSSLHSKRESVNVKSSRQDERTPKPQQVPETPVTEFEDTPISPESRSPQMPNIMVLGPSSDGSRGGRWSSTASNMSSYSHSSNRTSSTATTTTATEDPNLTKAKILVLRAAMNLGFNRDGIADAKAGATALQKFVQSLPTGSFGSLATHTTLLQQYKDSIIKEGFVPRNHTLPARGKRVSAQEISKAVQAMMNASSRFNYLRELYKFVFQFPLEEADSRRTISIQV